MSKLIKNEELASFNEGNYLKKILPLLSKTPLIYVQEPWSSPRPDHDFSDKEPQIVILIGDESHKPVNYKNCLVFRNYIHPNNAAENERAIPLGYALDFYPPNINFIERKFLISFTGFCGNDNRKSLAEKLIKLKEKHRRVFVNTTESFGKGLSTSEYSLLMAETMIAICPAGGSYETFRLTEALKAGCIPVQKPRPLQWYDPKDLIVWINEWEQLDNIVENFYRLTPQELIEKSNLSKKFYENNLSPLAVANYINKEWAIYIEKKYLEGNK